MASSVGILKDFKRVRLRSVHLGYTLSVPKTQLSSILFGDTMVTQYRVRLYPPFGYSILYKEYNLATQFRLTFHGVGIQSQRY